MAEESIDVTERGDVKEYWSSGGVLTEPNYELAMSVLNAVNDGEEPMKVQKTNVQRAKSMAHFSGVPLTPVQEYLYAIFEQVSVDAVTFSRFPMKEYELGQPMTAINREGYETPKSLTDQRLLAEVLLLTGDREHYEEYKGKYPTIFGKKA